MHLHPTTILQGDDVAVIIGLIEENLIEGIEQKSPAETPDSNRSVAANESKVL